MPKILDTTERFGGPPPRCICLRGGERCEADPTAEDLRCDRCRGDRCQILYIGAPEEPKATYRHVLADFQVSRC